MKNLQNNKIPRQIVFTTKLNEVATSKANKMGVSVPEYIRYLILQDNQDQHRDMPFVSDEMEEMIGKSIQDYLNGKTTDLKTKKDVVNYVDKLVEDA